MFLFDVSFIIPAQNTGTSLIPTINSIFSQLGDFTFEIIVILGPRESLNYHRPLTLINAPKMGASQARNLGLEKAQGEFVALIDGDTVLSSNWLSVLLSELKDGLWLGGQGRIRTLGRNPENLFGKFRELSSRLSDDTLILSRYPLPVLNSAASLFRNLPTLRFDPSLKAAEDVELSWRYLRLNNGGYFYSGLAVANCYYSPESFIKFFYRNLKLGFYLGKIIKRQNVYHRDFSNFFLQKMRANFRMELRIAIGFALIPGIARIVASAITLQTCLLASVFSGTGKPREESLRINEIPQIILNGVELKSDIRLVALDSTLRSIDLKMLTGQSFRHFEIMSQGNRKFLIIARKPD